MLTTSCVVGPGLKKPIHYLNGEHYSGTKSPSAGGLPLVLHTKQNSTIISGQLISKSMHSANRVDVSLYTNKEKFLGMTQTGQDGSFRFNLKLESGKYYISFLHNIEHFEVSSYKVQLGPILY